MARLERLVRVHPHDARAPLALPAMLYFVFGHFRLVLVLRLCDVCVSRDAVCGSCVACGLTCQR